MARGGPTDLTHISLLGVARWGHNAHWNDGTVESCNLGTLESWNLGTLESQSLGNAEPWNLEVVVP